MLYMICKNVKLLFYVHITSQLGVLRHECVYRWSGSNGLFQSVPQQCPQVGTTASKMNFEYKRMWSMYFLENVAKEKHEI